MDCNGDLAPRERELATLRGFDPAPSFILDSGGGWHGYWLLETPFKLNDATDRDRMAKLLRGLSAALGGDPAYVKSTASVMRLPGSINTKPERNNTMVCLVESYPERHYPITTFAWLEAKPEQIADMPVISLNTNGQHPLPKRTEAYLMSGALNGHRNTELFAAACQLRDAGYSQSEAERELIARHLADGSSEREARASIDSAFSRPPRDPIPQSQETARECIEALVSRYDHSNVQAERPSAAQIREAVTACAALDPLEWAEQRRRLKAVCGDGLKVSDLDRIYRETKRELKQQQAQGFRENEGYFVIDGCIVYRKETYQGIVEKAVTDWAAEVIYQTCRIDDDGKETHVTTVELRRGDTVKQLDVPGEVFVDDLALRRFIGANAGAWYVVRAGMSKHLIPAIVQLSGDFPMHRHYNFMGWMQLDGRWVYVSPQDCVGVQGSLEEPPSVELDSRLRDYGLQSASWQDSLSAFDALIKVLPPDLAAPLIAFALLPILQRFFPAAAPRPALHLVGTSGSGKSEIASLLTSFYGRFSRDTPPAQWGDTINTVETLGYSLANALYWVDDFKPVYVDDRSFTRFLQSYSRGMGRGRLTRDARIRQDRPCRGLVLSTGETTIEGEKSVLARMLVLEIPPWEKRDPGGKGLAGADALREHLPGFTSHFVAWVARQLENNVFQHELAARFAFNVQGYREKLAATNVGQSNTGRVIQNWAVLITVYQLLSRFFRSADADYLLPDWSDTLGDTVSRFRQERASEVFLDILSQLIAGGQAVIDANMNNPSDYPSGVTVIGYRDGNYIYLLPEIARREVDRVQTLRFTTTAIGQQLREDGILVSGGNSLSVQKRGKWGRVRFWQLKSDFLG